MSEALNRLENMPAGSTLRDFIEANDGMHDATFYTASAWGDRRARAERQRIVEALREEAKAFEMRVAMDETPEDIKGRWNAMAKFARAFADRLEKGQ